MNPAHEPRIVVLAGGISDERAVSLGSGRACAVALSRILPTRLVDITSREVLPEIDSSSEVAFSTLHGEFGEDGGMQQLLDRAGILYAGCDQASSALTFDKSRTKEIAHAQGLAVAPSRDFNASTLPAASELIAALGSGVVLKPSRGGSSVGLAISDGEAELAQALDRLTSGDWMAEQRILGREVTVGVLGDRALPVVEIVPRDGVFDYEAKYTKGLTEYLAPAPLDEGLTARLQADALKVFSACGGRDFGRIDFIITPENDWIFLEINTLPGMKETSLLPMGARCVGLDFTALVCEMIKPAIIRLQQRNRSGGGE